MTDYIIKTTQTQESLAQLKKLQNSSGLDANAKAILSLCLAIPVGGSLVAFEDGLKKMLQSVVKHENPMVQAIEEGEVECYDAVEPVEVPLQFRKLLVNESNSLSKLFKEPTNEQKQTLSKLQNVIDFCSLYSKYAEEMPKNLHVVAGLQQKVPISDSVTSKIVSDILDEVEKFSIIYAVVQNGRTYINIDKNQMITDLQALSNQELKHLFLPANDKSKKSENERTVDISTNKLTFDISTNKLTFDISTNKLTFNHSGTQYTVHYDTNLTKSINNALKRVKALKDELTAAKLCLPEGFVDCANYIREFLIKNSQYDSGKIVWITNNKNSLETPISQAQDQLHKADLLLKKAMYETDPETLLGYIAKPYENLGLWPKFKDLLNKIGRVFGVGHDFSEVELKETLYSAKVGKATEETEAKPLNFTSERFTNLVKELEQQTNQASTPKLP
jgi:hypothetical protein